MQMLEYISFKKDLILGEKCLPDLLENPNTNIKIFATMRLFFCSNKHLREIIMSTYLVVKK